MRHQRDESNLSDRLGTVDNPIVIKSHGEEQYVGCTGVPADTHEQNWMVISRDRPIERCTACGNVLKMDYIGVEDPHRKFCSRQALFEANSTTDGHPPEKFEPATFADFIKPEYTYK